MGIAAITSDSRIKLLYFGVGDQAKELNNVIHSGDLYNLCDTTEFSDAFHAALACASGNYDVCVVDVEGQNKLAHSFVQSLLERTPFNPPSPIIVVADQKKKVVRAFKHIKWVTVFARQELSANVLHQVIISQARINTLHSEIHASELRYDAVLDAIAEGVVICDVDGKIESINYKAERIFEFQNGNDGIAFLTSCIAKEYRKEVRKYFKDSRSGHDLYSPVFSKELKGQRKSGQTFPMELVINCTELGSRKFHTCIVRDISLSRMREEELKLTATAFETHTAILITSANGTILRVNPAFTSITGYELHEVVGKNPKILQSGHHSRDFYDRMWRIINETGKWEGEIWNKRKNGEIYPEYQTITAVKDNQGNITHYVGTFQDITERKQTQALVEHQAYYDSLTNLPNRRMILDRLNQELASSRRHNVFGALLFLDLDHFKHLNDSMGHDVGDHLLQQLARRLSSLVRTEDTVARLGGDEFVVLLSNLGPKKKSAMTTVTAIAKKIHMEIARPYDLSGHSYNFTPSIGVTLFPFDHETADDVLKHADTAMYRAKNKGRNAICYYQPSMQDEADSRLRIEKELRTAINKNEFVLYYQPQINSNGFLVGAEALLRWEHPRNGIVEPVSFISLAEEANLIQPIGFWVLETAIQQYTLWKDSGLFNADEYIAVNVSPKQLQQDDFVDHVGGLLSRYEVTPCSLKLELTENILLTDLYDVVEKMNQLKRLGVSFSMDDFGTGFSSLSYLKRLPFDQIKIDKTFVRDVAIDVNDAVIVETIIAMAEHLKLDVIAEGVETVEEFNFLQQKGCNSYQGFYFGRPLDPVSFEQSLRMQMQTRKAHIN